MVIGFVCSLGKGVIKGVFIRRKEFWGLFWSFVYYIFLCVLEVLLNSI